MVINMYINYECYKVFNMVVKYQSITAAAKAMDLTQPTVTHYIQKLEENLNCILFLRGKRGITLTPEGEIIYHYIDIACENMMRAEKELERYRKNESGELAIGANETTLHHFLFPYITKYRQLYPFIKLKIYNNVAPVIMEQIERGNLDCGIIFSHNNFEKEELFVKELANLPYIMISGNAMIELKNRQVMLRELENYPFVGLDENTLSGQAHRKYFIENNFEYQPEIILATADLVVPTVANNLGIGLVPKPFATDALNQGEIFEIEIKEEIPYSSICFVCEKSRINKPSVKAFLECLGNVGV